MKNLQLLICLVFFTTLSCQNDKSKTVAITTKFALPEKLSEVSGIVATDSLIWVIEDSGNKTELYGLNDEGKIEQTIQVDKISNIDWEDLTNDNKNNLYVGDFGNNDNDRKDLVIYKISTLNSENTIEKINFYYPEQTDFPAKKKEKLYDCEAFFLYQNNFYLFTKNRSKGFDGTTLVYKIPALAGNHPAQLIGKFKTCSNFNSCAITGATVSPNEQKVVLLSHDRLWLFEEYEGDAFLDGKITELALDHHSQKEAVDFKDEDILFIADEKTKKIGGNVYEVSINSLKSAH